MIRCFGDGDPLYERYHDTEWGFPVADERALFELLSVEAFQAGLSWRTILGKREAFRSAFANFDADAVARFGPADVERLLGDAGIVRHRAKIEATIGNARAVLQQRELTHLARAAEHMFAMLTRHGERLRPRRRRLVNGATWVR